ncbi:dUTP diphosphatase [Pseudomaricurvus alkylphenolicus]|uniref:dUTP diphosphatase n=1 Tax=Pseudomaricurvus alkylphenolicus TaxID=1306991 RepID=UPI001420C1E2|nr:dUTP diphosphatase [Pseudomaricurvus alkylphenolicus]NIB41213.1 dUTP diphosphatase [Pseudomaricurvus alkylphenolicus]
MQQQIQTMLELQDSMNTKVNSEWRSQGFEWYRAIWIECGELLDHYGWKWWKKQTPDVEQVQLELIDIWHFGLSILLQSGQSSEAIATTIEKELVLATDEEDFRLDLERFAGEVLTTRSFSVASFGRLMAGIDMDFEMLFKGYVGKNVLNFFRQDHGYQDGTYTKIWDGREDNEHLVEASQALDAAEPDFQDQLYRALSQRYQAVQA